ncbi:MAG TPA: response regulator [Vicinamibacterales bacterium]|nr:response regulator [Vicinamibacterales bacterium]
MSQDNARRARVLVVDDEPGIREFVDRTLQLVGYRTVVAESGSQALGLVQSEEPFDLLLTDMRMPGMNGDELARRVRKQQPEVKVLYLTGFSDQLFKEKGGMWEGEAFLDKPVSAMGLLQAVSLLLYGEIERSTLQDLGKAAH